MNWYRQARGVQAAVLLTAALSSACSVALAPEVSRPDRSREVSVRVVVHDQLLTLHLASPRTPPTAAMPLVLYASGDGGWFGAAVGMFRTIASTGMATVGFSTKALLHLEHQRSRPLTVQQLAEDYRQIVDAARSQMRLPADAPVVLTGWSRGASLGVLVAAGRDVDLHIAGLVAIGLAARDRLDIEGDSDDDTDAPAPATPASGARGASFDMYPLLARIAPRRAAVIQASGDGYLPAARARQLFGDDSMVKRFVTIDAHNHRFSGGESSFASALVDAVGWVAEGEGEQQ
jgi:hypothetical protein